MGTVHTYCLSPSPLSAAVGCYIDGVGTYSTMKRQTWIGMLMIMMLDLYNNRNNKSRKYKYQLVELTMMVLFERFKTQYKNYLGVSLQYYK